MDETYVNFGTQVYEGLKRTFRPDMVRVTHTSDLGVQSLQRDLRMVRAHAHRLRNLSRSRTDSRSNQ